MEELWADIPGFEGDYQASTLGNVRSIKRGLCRMLNQVVSTGGYKVVCLSLHGKAKSRRVHQLVAMTFIRLPERGEYVCHNDGDRANNRPENLRIDTPLANSNDMDKHGTRARGERHGNAKLTSESVAEIRRLKARGLLRSDIAAAAGVTVSAVQDVLSGRRWSHV
ncbi:MAG: NUMOD4 domain-containing protein [Thiobacillus sp.]